MDSLRFVPGFSSDFTFIRGQALLRDPVVAQVLPVLPSVPPALQVSQQGFTYDDVIWRGVVVELLVPLFVEVARLL
jgi:hypothetical protein